MRTNAIFAIGLFACMIPLSAAEQGGTIAIAAGATLVDSSSGTTHTIQLQASEFNNPGIGAVTLLLGGGGLQVCTTQGGGSMVLGQPAPAAVCGTAGGMNVNVDRCKATIEAHGSAHSDVPHTPFLGAVTIDIAFSRQAGGVGDGQVEITVHTPKQLIHLKGKLTGVVTMPTCNF